MTSTSMRWLCLVAIALSTAITGHAQGPAASPTTADPRVGLMPGFRNAGEAARNMQLVATLPKPDGFFDPKAPAGPPYHPSGPKNLALRRRRLPTPRQRRSARTASPYRRARRQASTRKSRSPTQISRSAEI